MIQKEYLTLLERSYTHSEDTRSRLEFLAGDVFNFTTYDGEMDELFATKAIEVCEAIVERKTFDFIEKSKKNYRWYLLMINMPFFNDKLEWGTSVRGAWFDTPYKVPAKLGSCGFYDEAGKQILTCLEFTRDELESFVRALIQFAKSE